MIILKIIPWLIWGILAMLGLGVMVGGAYLIFEEFYFWRGKPKKPFDDPYDDKNFIDTEA